MADDDYWPGWPWQKPVQDGNQIFGPAATDIIKALQAYHPSWWQGPSLLDGAGSLLNGANVGLQGGLTGNGPSLPGVGGVANGLPAPADPQTLPIIRNAPLNPKIEMQPLPARRIVGVPDSPPMMFDAKSDAAAQTGTSVGIGSPIPSLGSSGPLQLNPQAGRGPGGYDGGQYAPKPMEPGIRPPEAAPNTVDWSRGDPKNTTVTADNQPGIDMVNAMLERHPSWWQGPAPVAAPAVNPAGSQTVGAESGSAPTGSFRKLPQPSEMEQGESGGGYHTYGTPPNGAGQWGTPKTLEVVTAVSNALSNRPAFTPLYVGNMSLEHGGPFPPHGAHGGHSDGLGVDVRPASVDGGDHPVQWNKSGYDKVATQRIVDAFLKTGQVSAVLFNDPEIRGVTPWRDHDNHMHVMIKP